MPLEYTFDEVNHICRDLKGNFIPTVSQVLEANNLCVNFRQLVERGFIKRDLLDRRSRIGSEVHSLTDTHDEFGEVPDTWLTDETAGFVESWIGLKRISGFKPTAWSIRRTELINGMPVSGETDTEGTMGRYHVLVDKKTGATTSDSWGLQLAGYEMLKFRSPKIGRVARMVAHLQKDGSPGKFIEYQECSKIDGIHYGDTFLAGLHNLHVALRRGYLSERDFIS